jgi:outer membrane protein TolC
MKSIGSFLNIVGILLIFCLTGNAQNNQKANLLNDNIETKLPPLGTLLDSALARNPYVKFRDLQIVVNKYKLKSDQAVWLKNLGVQTDIRYGTFDNFSTNTSEGQTPSLISTRRNQTNYGLGAYLKLPLFDLVNRKYQVNIATAEVDQANQMAEFQRDEVRQLVIRQYNDVILKQRILKIKSKYFATSKINMEMIEKEFQTGVISISEYSRISEIVTRTESDYENARVDFVTSYMILEEIVGIKFNLTQSLNLVHEGY